MRAIEGVHDTRSICGQKEEGGPDTDWGGLLANLMCLCHVY